jgi:hypothetical protein
MQRCQGEPPALDRRNASCVSLRLPFRRHGLHFIVHVRSRVDRRDSSPSAAICRSFRTSPAYRCGQSTSTCHRSSTEDGLFFRSVKPIPSQCIFNQPSHQTCLEFPLSSRFLWLGAGPGSVLRRIFYVGLAGLLISVFSLTNPSSALVFSPYILVVSVSSISNFALLFASFLFFSCPSSGTKVLSGSSDSSNQPLRCRIPRFHQHVARWICQQETRL